MVTRTGQIKGLPIVLLILITGQSCSCGYYFGKKAIRPERAEISIPGGGAEAIKPAGPIAVLYFKNLSFIEKDETEWIGKWLGEELTRDLTGKASEKFLEWEKIEGITEGNETGLGRMIGAKTIITGSYMKLGDRIRLNAKFVDVESEATLNAVEVLGDASEISGLEKELAFKLLISMGIDTESEFPSSGSFEE